MKILIADDEELVRFDLRGIVSEIDPDCIVKEVVNGREMIKEISTNEYDIAFVDIKMPGISGLEAIQTVKKVAPATQWIILTGHTEFDFAHKAIKLDVLDYLLKPVSREEAAEVMWKAAGVLTALNRRRNERFENRVAAVFNNSSEIDFKDIFSGKQLFNGLLIKADSPCRQKELTALLRKFATFLRREMGRRQDRHLLVLAVLPEGDLCLIGAGDDPSGALAELYETTIRPIEMDRLMITCFISVSVNDFSNLIDNLNRLSSIAAGRIWLGLKYVYGHLDFGSVPLDYLKHIDNLTDFLKNDIITQAIREFSMLKQLPDNPPGNEEIKNFLSFTLGSVPGDDIPLFFDELIQRKSKTAGNKEYYGKSDHIVKRAVELIKAKYAQPIGVAQIADMMDITPNYLSSVFKQAMNTSFTRYITNIRLENARKLLSNPGVTVKETAAKSGYLSSKHFSKLFSEKYGISPSELIALAT